VPGLAISASNYQTDLPTALSALQNTTEGTLVLVFHANGGLDTNTFKESLQIIKNAQVQVVTFKEIAQVYESRVLLSDGIDDYVEVRHNIILEPQLPFAIEAWVKAEQPTGDGKILWMGTGYQLTCSNNGYVYVNYKDENGALGKANAQQTLCHWTI
jgi:hypothetical protein